MKGKTSFIIKIAILVLVIITILVGKKIIDKKTYDFTAEVKECLNNYFSSGDTDDLDKIIKLMDANKNDRDYIGKIEDFSSNEVEKQYAYISEKYLCDKNNLNACNQALNEIKDINRKIENLYDYKSKAGDTIINPSSYKSLQRDGQDKEQNINSIIKSLASKNAPTSESIRLERCSKATDCNCNQQYKTCSCYYIAGNLKVALVCENKDYIPSNN